MLPSSSRRVLRSLLHPHCTPAPSTFLCLARALPAAASPSIPLRRAYATASKPAKTLKQSTQLIDEQIPHPLITLVDPSGGGLLPPAKLADLLLQLDRSRFSIVLVDEKKDVPVCRIVDKKADYQRAMEKKQKSKAASATAAAAENAPASTQAKAKAGPPKEVHLTWGVTSHDLSHKLGRAREFLSKGNRVVVVLKDKKGVGKAGGDEQARVRAEIRGVLEGEGEAGSEEKGRGKCRKEGGKGGEWRMEFERA